MSVSVLEESFYLVVEPPTTSHRDQYRMSYLID